MLFYLHTSFWLYPHSPRLTGSEWVLPRPIFRSWFRRTTKSRLSNWNHANAFEPTAQDLRPLLKDILIIDHTVRKFKLSPIDPAVIVLRFFLFFISNFRACEDDREFICLEVILDQFREKLKSFFGWQPVVDRLIEVEDLMAEWRQAREFMVSASYLLPENFRLKF